MKRILAILFLAFCSALSAASLTPAELHEQVAAVAPITGLDFGSLSDKSTWTVQFKAEATDAQKQAAQAVIDAAPAPIVTQHKIVSPYEFYKRFTSAEKAALLASTDANVVEFRQDMQLYQIVILDGQECETAMNYLVQLGILTADRKAAILQ